MMKKITSLFAGVAIILLAGCTTTTVKTEQWELHRTSFMQKLDIPSVAISPDGTATLTGYKTDGGYDAVAVITAAAVSAAIKSAAP